MTPSQRLRDLNQRMNQRLEETLRKLNESFNRLGMPTHVPAEEEDPYRFAAGEWVRVKNTYDVGQIVTRSVRKLRYGGEVLVYGLNTSMTEGDDLRWYDECKLMGPLSEMEVIALSSSSAGR